MIRTTRPSGRISVPSAHLHVRKSLPVRLRMPPFSSFSPSTSIRNSTQIIKELLDWWNESISPGSRPSGTIGVEKDDDELAQLRAARRRRVLAAKNT
ncbi:hypothetical protein D9611_003335 [Ephemerocybe angulata]|uniref:Uncharacterized protein n=1 Tax=Ephemerocybe angulata TaxID=980116 RepID=A0A8H5C8H9_9AGAR|nr:hypothetical protein D9611_003335 [Tulosesus angulatus]